MPAPFRRFNLYKIFELYCCGRSMTAPIIVEKYVKIFMKSSYH